MSDPPRDSDKALFREAMDDVKTLTQDKVHNKPSPRTARVQNNVESPGVIISTPITEESVTTINRGINQQDLRRLKRGQVEPVARIDLHGLRQEDAEFRLKKRIALAKNEGVRCLIVIHGKGQHSEQGRSVLKQAVQSLLLHHPDVVVTCEATPRDGGSGATYAYLRKMKRRPVRDFD